MISITCRHREDEYYAGPPLLTLESDEEKYDDIKVVDQEERQNIDRMYSDPYQGIHKFLVALSNIFELIHRQKRHVLLTFYFCNGNASNWYTHSSNLSKWNTVSNTYRIPPKCSTPLIVS